MNTTKKILLFFCMVGMLGAFATIATADPITAVTRDGIDPDGLDGDNILTITVDAFTVGASELGFGVTSEPDGSDISDQVDNLNVADLDSFSFTMVTDFTGHPGGGYSSRNGDDVDFFIFEIGSNDDIDVTATYDIGGGATEGLPITFLESDWGEPGGDAGGQVLSGIAFRVTDLLDEFGAALPESALILSTRIGDRSGGIDANSYSVVIPEPSSIMLAIFGAMLLGFVGRRQR